MDAPQARRIVLEIKREGLERKRGAEPHEAVRTHVDVGLKRVGASGVSRPTAPSGAGTSASQSDVWADAPVGAPGGSGRDGDSREHRRASYLIEPDTNAIVGELPRTAPPVIGAEEDYR